MVRGVPMLPSTSGPTGVIVISRYLSSESYRKPAGITRVYTRAP
jgi:hypothetical protein